MSYTYKYPRPMVSVDTVYLDQSGDRPRVVLIRRGKEPYKDHWALPGGFLEMDEDLEDGAARELQEETGVVAGRLIQVGAFGHPKRDPRGRCISVVFAGIAPAPLQPTGGDDAAEADLFPLDGLPPLAFDHKLIIQIALQTLQNADLLP